MDIHYDKVQRLKAEQQSERDAQWAQHRTRTSNVSFDRAKDDLIAERQTAAPPPSERGFKRGPKTERVSENFARQAENPAPPAAEQFREAAKREPLTRAEQIRRDMEAWRQRNRDRDQGREL
ncbi:MAG: hypothetical protein KKB37_16310 [Alphaproteobacteria bacterium]|nr:hypothetical protein [Alphaproteobacteria bacterium]